MQNLFPGQSNLPQSRAHLNFLNYLASTKQSELHPFTNPHSEDEKKSTKRVQEYVTYLNLLKLCLEEEPEAFKKSLAQYGFDKDGNNVVQVFINGLKAFPMYKTDSKSTDTNGNVILTAIELCDAKFMHYMEQCLRHFIVIYPDLLTHKNRKGKNVLYTACQYGDIFLASAFASNQPQDNFIAWLMERAPDRRPLDIDDNTLLHDAAMYGYAETVQLLIKKDFQADQLNRYRQNPLYFASPGRLRNYRFSDYTRTLAILLQAQANQEYPTVYDQYHYNPKENIETLLQYKQPKGTPTYRNEGGNIIKVSNYYITWAYDSKLEEQTKLQDGCKSFSVICNESTQKEGFWLETPIPSLFCTYEMLKREKHTEIKAFFISFDYYQDYQYWVLLTDLQEFLTQNPELMQVLVYECASSDPNGKGHTILTQLIEQLRDNLGLFTRLSSTKPYHEENLKNLNLFLEQTKTNIEFLLDKNNALVNTNAFIGSAYNIRTTALHEAAELISHLPHKGYSYWHIKVNLFKLLVDYGADLTVKDYYGCAAYKLYPQTWKTDPNIPSIAWEWESRRNLVGLIGVAVYGPPQVLMQGAQKGVKFIKEVVPSSSKRP